MKANGWQLMAGEFVALKGSSVDALRASLQRVKGQFASMGPELEKANRASVDWLSDRALEILEAKVEANNREPSTARDAGRLRNAIAQEKIATFDKKGFRWGVASLLNKTSAGVYWRAIEQGSDKFVNKPFPVKVHPFGGERSAVQFRMIDPGERKQRRSGGKFIGGFESVGGPRIRRPIPAYHYLSEAADDFIEQEIYTKLLADASLQWKRVLAKAKRTGGTAGSARG